MTARKRFGPGFELGEMNQRHASDWVDYLQGRQGSEDVRLMPPMGSLGGLKCQRCRVSMECNGHYCLAPISQTL